MLIEVCIMKLGLFLLLYKGNSTGDDFSITCPPKHAYVGENDTLGFNNDALKMFADLKINDDVFKMPL